MKFNVVHEFVFRTVVILSLAFLIWFVYGRQNPIVYVDSVKLINGYRGMHVARRELESRTVVWQANLDTLKNEFEAKLKEYQTSRASLTKKERELSEEVLRLKQEQYLNYQKVISEKIQKEDQELTSQVLVKVNDFIKRYGQQRGYSIIMAATEYGNIVYAAENMDVTDEILEGLNNEMLDVK
jgi:outer membrane protein